MNTNQGNPNRRKSIFRKFSFLIDETVLQVALVGVVLVAVVDGMLSIGGGTIA
jgi:hypothetical protein